VRARFIHQDAGAIRLDLGKVQDASGKLVDLGMDTFPIARGEVGELKGSIRKIMRKLFDLHVVVDQPTIQFQRIGKAGDVAVICAIHPRMKMIVKVVD